MISNFPFYRLSVPLLFLVGTLSIVILTGSNQSLFLWINHQSQLFPALFWANVTMISDAATGFALMTLALKKHSKLVFWAICGGVACAVFVRILKVGASAPRPAGILSTDDFLVIGRALKSNAFPSGHTATAFFLAAIISGLNKSRYLLIGCLFAATMMAISRLAVGVHWPIDVTVGAMIGWTLGILTVNFAANAPSASKKQKYFAMTVCLTGCIYLTQLNTHIPGVEPLQYIIAGLCFIIGLRTLYLEIAPNKETSV